MFRDEPLSWIRESPYFYDDRRFHEQYIASVYWAFTTITTVGFGDISPKNYVEQGFAMIVMGFGTVVYATVFGTMTAIISDMSNKNREYTDKMQAVNQYMMELKLPPETKSMVRAYYDFVWKQKKTFSNNQTLLDELPVSLYSLIARYTHQRMLQQSELFKSFNEEFLYVLSMRLGQSVCMLPEEVIFLQDDNAESMIFIHKGSVALLGKNDKHLATRHEVDATLQKVAELRSKAFSANRNTNDSVVFHKAQRAILISKLSGGNQTGLLSTKQDTTKRRGSYHNELKSTFSVQSMTGWMKQSFRVGGGVPGRLQSKQSQFGSFYNNKAIQEKVGLPPNSPTKASPDQPTRMLNVTNESALLREILSIKKSLGQIQKKLHIENHENGGNFNYIGKTSESRKEADDEDARTILTAEDINSDRSSSEELTNLYKDL
eukprot:g2245.t1